MYNIPKGIGQIYKRQGMAAWTGWLWVSAGTVSDMLTILPHLESLYLNIHELNENRSRWIVDLTLQTILQMNKWMQAIILVFERSDLTYN